MFKFIINQDTTSTSSNQTKKIVGYLFVVLFFPFLRFIQPGFDKDSSWQISLNVAIAKHMIFGKDFVFTYGPLGFLLTRFVDMMPAYIIIGYILFLYVATFRFINVLHKGIKLNILLPTLFILKFLFDYKGYNGEFYLFIISIFLLISYNRSNKVIDLVIVSTSSVFLFYIKINTGLILTVLMLFSMIVLLAYKKMKLIESVYIILFTIALHLLVISIVRIDFWGYISNSFILIKYYNESMFIEPDFKFILIALFSMLNTGYILFKISKEGFDNAEKILLLNFVLILFIAYKYSIVRAGADHNSAIIFVCLFIILVSNYFYTNKIVFIQLFLILIPFLGYMFNADNYMAFFSVSNVFKHINRDLKLKEQKKNYEDSVNFPNKWSNIIGNNSVDVVPYYTSLIYYKNLNYSPRPIPSAFCEESDQLNLNHFSNNSAPEFVILHDGTIDNRPPFWDDNLLKIALMYNYTLIDTISEIETTRAAFDYSPLKLLLFKKNKTLKRVVFTKIKEEIIKLNKAYSIPIFNQPILMKAAIQNDVLGKVQSFLYQPSPITLYLQKDSEALKYNGVIPILKSGVLINRPLNDKNSPCSFDLAAVSNFYRAMGIYKDDNIKLTFRGNPVKINEDIKIEFYKISAF